MTTHKFLKNLGIVVLTTGLVACNGAEDRKAKYMEEGKQLFQAGDYEKANWPLKTCCKSIRKTPKAASKWPKR